MTNEEIFETIKEIDAELTGLCGPAYAEAPEPIRQAQGKGKPEKKLSKQEARHKHNLEFRKDLLEKIIEARANYRTHREFELTMLYGAVTSVGEKYPLLIPFLRAKSSFGL